MRLNQLLQIRQTPIELNYRYPLGRQSIRQPKADLQISKHESELTVTRDPPRLNVDSTRSFESMNRYNYLALSHKTADEAKEMVLRHIGEIGDDALAMTLSRGEAHVSICKRKIGEDFVELTPAHIPVAPDINWHPGSPTKVDFTPFRMDFRWHVNLKPEIDYEVGKFDMHVAQWNKVEVAYTGGPHDIIIVGTGMNKKI